MTTTKRPTRRVAVRVLAAAACLSVPVLGLVVLAGGPRALLPGQAAAADQFRVYDAPPAGQTKVVKPAQAGEPAEVELTTWEKTLHGSNST